MTRQSRTDLPPMPQRCLAMIEVTDVACVQMKQLRGYYCADCPVGRGEDERTGES